MINIMFKKPIALGILILFFLLPAIVSYTSNELYHALRANLGKDEAHSDKLNRRVNVYLAAHPLTHYYPYCHVTRQYDAQKETRCREVVSIK